MSTYSSPPGSSSGYGETPPYPPPQPQQVSIRLPQTRPLVTYFLLGLTVLVFLGQAASQATTGRDWLVIFGAKYTPAILAGEVWRLFTPMLLHAGLMHIGFNMYALYSFGPTLERHYGHTRFLALYLLAGFAGNVLSFLLSPGVSVGASTAVFGLLGAEGVFLYHNKALFGESARSALTNIIMLALINLGIGLASNGSIDNWGHIGGLVGGTLFAWLAGPRLHVEGVFPNFSLVDQREIGQVVTAAGIVACLFATLAGVRFFLG